MKYINLLIILALSSCSSAIQETELAEKILHDVEIAEKAIEHDLEEPPGCCSKQEKYAYTRSRGLCGCFISTDYYIPMGKRNKKRDKRWIN